MLDNPNGQPSSYYPTSNININPPLDIRIGGASKSSNHRFQSDNIIAATVGNNNNTYGDNQSRSMNSHAANMVKLLPFINKLNQPTSNGDKSDVWSNLRSYLPTVGDTDGDKNNQSMADSLAHLRALRNVMDLQQRNTGDEHSAAETSLHGNRESGDDAAYHPIEPIVTITSDD